VLKSFFSRWSFVLIKSKKFRDEIFASIRDSFPGWVIEVELSKLDLLHDLLVGGTVERWDTGKNNESDDTDRPNIAFSTVRFSKNFWSNIIRSSELFIKLLALTNNKRCTEIDNLNLIEFLVCFKKNVLWFEISMNDVVYVAIVDARKDLSDKNTSIFLVELTSFDDLIEELTTFADIGDNVVSLLILEELVHLKNIWMIKILKNINFIEKHPLLIFIHMGFSEDFDSTLVIAFSVDTNTNFSKCS